ncbi:MAG: matrixin family metalloprotease, partial [Candidatus Aenigmarchaeota archaeon]|nr:matrixin family metalloprotease [Candidatus Aenigmarchaeota archaeon]
DKAKEHAKASFTMPEHAVEVAPGVFYLGKAIDKGRIVEGYAMFVKPGTVCGNGICEPGENARKCPEDCTGEDPEEPDTSSCYEFLAKRAKWKTVEPYMVDPTNIDGLDGAFVKNNLALDINKWETEAGVGILADEVVGIVNRNAIGSLNGANEVMFADIDSQGAIGVTIIWGVFGGPPPFRELVEWDMIFDDVDFNWSATGEADKMDFENIATHELGHAVGMGDLYTDLCSEQTMYGYANNGETKKRTLEAGDIAGLNILYN